jgi:hypothetical protein
MIVDVFEIVEAAPWARGLLMLRASRTPGDQASIPANAATAIDVRVEVA